MKSLPDRKPFALANWKMACTISESLAFVRDFRAAIGDLATAVDVVLCPAYTALHAVARAVTDSPIAVGGQDLCAAPGLAHTGQISAPLLADVGCTWAMLNHWEVRRRAGETDGDVNRKVRSALQAGLRPILLIGEATSQRGRAARALAARLPHLLKACTAEQIARMAIVYEPEWSIGVEQPAPPEAVAAGCSAMRRWVGRRYGQDAARQVRIIYGGSVTPAHAAGLLASPDVDGLGASRKGRDPAAFARIVQAIAGAKTQPPGDQADD